MKLARERICLLKQNIPMNLKYIKAMQKQTLIGPFSQIITMAELPLKGALSDDQLQVIEQGGILIKENTIAAIGKL